MKLINAFVSAALVPVEAASHDLGQPAARAKLESPKLELKGTTLPVIAVMATSRSIAALESAFADKLGGARDFFEGEAALIDFSRCAQADEDETLDVEGLLALIRRFGLSPVAVRGASPREAEAFKAAGLAVIAVPPPRSPSVSEPAPTSNADASPHAPLASEEDASTSAASIVQGELALEAGIAHDAPAAPDRVEPVTDAQPPDAARPIGALVVDRALRSGQRVYARGRDLVVLAQVNPGAEVIADGSIHCYGPLRGRAVAGAGGDAKATIFASNFQAELVSIAGIYKNFETIPPEVVGRQICVRLREHGGASRIALDPINTE